MAQKYSSLSSLISDIKQDVGRVANKIARGVAQVAALDLCDAHTEIMNCYYSGYTPVQSYMYEYQSPDGKYYSGIAHGYKRTDNLKKSLDPKGVVPSGKHSFKATIEVSSQKMNDYVNSTGHTFPASSVFDLVWNQANRGLPPGYIGHIEHFDINTAPVGVWISGSPDNAMTEFVNTWGYQRGPMVADSIAFNI